jgi:hypothetical protein
MSHIDRRLAGSPHQPEPALELFHAARHAALRREAEAAQ